MTSRPVLFLDVDGVLNPYAAASCPEGYRTYDAFPGERVWLCARHGRWLASLAEWYELVWATGWEHHANRIISPVLGLPSLQVLEFPPDPDGWLVKLPVVASAVGDRPCAWVDDEHDATHREWARQREAPTLLVDVDPARGLQTAMIDELRAWAAALPSPR